MPDHLLDEAGAQAVHLHRQLVALGRGPRERWGQFRLHEVRCGGCSRVLVEVMDTDPYPVVLHWPSADLTSFSARSLRRGPRAWFAISKRYPEADDPDVRGCSLTSVCSCQTVEISHASIYDSLRRGERKRMWPAGNVT